MREVVMHLEQQQLPLDVLHGWPGNPRRGNVALIADSLAQHGQYRPIVVQASTMRVLAGNHTLLAALQLGWGELACTMVDCDDQQAARIVLVDNRSNDLASYDDTALLTMLQDIPDLSGTGYDAADLAALLDAIGPEPTADTDPDAAPPVDRALAPISASGDLWVLGPHRLMVGDSTDTAVVSLAMDDDVADLVWTDPPYGVAYVGKTKDALTIQNDSLDAGALETLLRNVFGSATRVCKPGAAWYVAAPAGPLFLNFGTVLAEFGIWRQTITWVKDQFVLGRSDYHYRHEPILYGWKPGAAHSTPPDRTQDTVWEIPRPKASADHPTMKPVELIVRSITNSSPANAVVLDPFAGSGSTLIACHQTRRRARLIELDPRYADVICRRFQLHTGTIPERAGQPVSFTVAGNVAA
jgi:DNA modification methylase